MVWKESAVNSWLSLIRMDDKTLNAYKAGFRAMTVWFTEDDEIMVKYYSTLRNARIAAKMRYRNNPYYKISNFRVEQIVL